MTNLETLYTWKDAETDYCRSLVMSAATKEVPDWAIESYLRTQIASARKDERRDCEVYLCKLLEYWRNHPRYLATLVYTCEHCGKQHANEFSRTCGDCDRLRESGDLDLED